MTHERTRHKQRTEKLLEDAQIKLSTVIADIFGVSGRAMLEALIAGERSPKALADLAHGTIKASHATLAESLTGRFEEHHGFMCRMLLDTVDYLTVQIDKLTARITVRLAELSTTEDDERPGQGTLIPITDTERLDEIPGIGPNTAQVILAEIGLDMSVFPTAGHLVSWAKLSPHTIQSSGKNTSGPTGKGNPWLRGALGEAAISAARTDTFLGAHYRRIVKRRGHMKALVAVARSISRSSVPSAPGPVSASRPFYRCIREAIEILAGRSATARDSCPVTRPDAFIDAWTLTPTGSNAHKAGRCTERHRPVWPRLRFRTSCLGSPCSTRARRTR